LRSFHPTINAQHRYITVGFIVVSTLVFIVVGKPIQILVFVGTLNGFILPIALSIMLLAVRQKRLVGNYLHPVGLQIAGWLVVAAMSFLVVKSLI
jgi:Mn2+/Fe2+ NRAMP family transporter